MMCDVILRERPGTGPAAVPSRTSFVPLASFNAACACWAADIVPRCAKAGFASPSAGVAAAPARRARREKRGRGDVSVTGGLPRMFVALARRALNWQADHNRIDGREKRFGANFTSPGRGPPAALARGAGRD